ncbi:MAG TPA: GNAT family N-acetyltransferase [Actinomycetales bacterium]|nr:GNAT family N-acetyltransferase [Actinomycetales bacterium]
MVTPAIRAATVDDTEALARLWVAARSARRVEAGLEGEAERSEALAKARADVSERLDDDMIGAVAEDADGLVAMAIAVPARADDGAGPERLPGVLHVSLVAVHPDRWGQGLAEIVLGSVLNAARRQGYTASQLWTQESNARGRRLYERMGWAPSGRAKVQDGEGILHYELSL